MTENPHSSHELLILDIKHILIYEFRQKEVVFRHFNRAPQTPLQAREPKGPG